MDTGAGTDTRLTVGIVAAASGGAVNIPGDAANGLDVDVTRIQGNVTVVDGGSSLTVDGAVTANAGTGTFTVDQINTAKADYDTGAGTVNQTMVGIALPASGGPVPGGTATNPLRVDPTGTTTQPVSDAGGSLTVDGTVSISGAVDTELPASAALADATSNPTTPIVGAALEVFNGTTWDRARGDTTNGLDVDVTRLPSIPAGTNNIGDVDVLTMPLTQVHGDTAHDALDGNNPIKIGGKASDVEPTAVAAGDRVNAWFDLFGRQVVLTGHATPENPVTASGSAAGVTVIPAPGVGVSLYICKGSVHNSNASAQTVSLRDGASGTIRWTASLGASGGGSLFDFGSRGWKLSANTALVMDAAAATAYCNITEYYIAP
ncbi:MAG: hypothetical protein ABIL14_01450 [candidate division WOR-3 bacterium]